MKKLSIIICSLLCPLSLLAQETLNLEQCREMALKYNKEMAASAKQTEGAHYTMKSYKGNFFPNFTASGTGLYSEYRAETYPSSCPMQVDNSCPMAALPTFRESI